MSADNPFNFNPQNTNNNNYNRNSNNNINQNNQDNQVNQNNYINNQDNKNIQNKNNKNIQNKNMPITKSQSFNHNYDDIPIKSQNNIETSKSLQLNKDLKERNKKH